LTLPGPAAFAVLVVLWSLCAVVVYAHAERHGSRHATAWGVWAFLASAVVLPLYFGLFWYRRRRR
jgi:hypothetical protein